MQLNMDYRIRPIWDVIGTIDGKEYPNQKVIVGNHRDAWVYGAVDPNSRTASLLETARGLGELLKSGWHPNRTIVLCSWDGEEYGLIGSTEWGEQNAEELMKDAVIYINVDAPVSGPNFGASAVPFLDKFITNVTKSVTDPKTQKSVFDAWFINQNKDFYEKQKFIPDTATTKLGRLGSGSDFTIFLDHLGVPAFDFGFSGPYGVYHSMLDDFYWMEHWGDPTFQYHATVAKVLGIAAIRLADDAILPFRYSDYAKSIAEYTRERQKRASEVESLKSVDFTPATDAALKFEKAATEMDSLIAIRKSTDDSKINEGLMSAGSFREIERAFIYKNGLPKSPWFKPQIYAPGFYTGYASQPLPGVARVIEKKDPSTLREEINILSRVLKDATQDENKIIEMLKK